MKTIFTLITIGFATFSYGQLSKFDLYGDVGLGINGNYSGPYEIDSVSTTNIGGSITLNYKPIKHLGIGVGAQMYKVISSMVVKEYYLPSIYVDIRPQVMIGNHKLMALIQAGKSFKRDEYDITPPQAETHGVFVGTGLGYSYKLTKFFSVFASGKAFSTRARMEVDNEKRGGKINKVGLAFSIGVEF